MVPLKEVLWRLPFNCLTFLLGVGTLLYGLIELARADDDARHHLSIGLVLLSVSVGNILLVRWVMVWAEHRRANH